VFGTNNFHKLVLILTRPAGPVRMLGSPLQYKVTKSPHTSVYYDQQVHVYISNSSNS
jgi:hypothetical protein